MVQEAASTKHWKELDRLLGEWEQARAGNPNRAPAGTPPDPGKASLPPTWNHKVFLLKRLPTSPPLPPVSMRLSAFSAIRIWEDSMHVLGKRRRKRRAQFIASIVGTMRDRPTRYGKRLCTAQGFELETHCSLNREEWTKRLGQSHTSLLENVEKQLVAVCEMLIGGMEPEALSRIRSCCQDACLVPDALEGLVPVRAEDSRHHRTDGGYRRDRFFAERLHGQLCICRGLPASLRWGREDILPTGRNFTLDPRRLPTRAAWRVGGRTSPARLSPNILEEEGVLPGNVAMFWMCNDMMWADGGDGARSFIFSGVVPWLGNGMVERVRCHPLEGWTALVST